MTHRPAAAASAPARPRPADLAELVRLPAVLSAPGDVIAGAAHATSGRPPAARTAALVAASSCLYLAGMAGNDWADREIDAVERPHRPIPSGRVAPPQAAGLAAGLAAAGLGFAALAGRRSLATATALAAAVATYDLAAKTTPLAPLSMAACRALDVLLGASLGEPRRAWRAAATVAAHTTLVTTVSTREVEGAGPALPAAATAASVAVAAVAGLGTTRDPLGRVLAGAYAAGQVREGVRATADPSPGNLQRLVGRSVLGTVPLQAALTAGTGARRAAAAVAALWPLARAAARRRQVS